MLPFSKLQGTGNDFVIIDNRNKDFDAFIGNLKVPEAVKTICERKRAVGADGLILIENSNIADFKWKFFNSDGSTAEMCGNGARCAARFAFKKGIASEKMRFETEAGIIDAVVSKRTVKVKLTEPFGLKANMEVEGIKGSFINTGVPHFVIFVDDTEKVNVLDIGRKIRFSKAFRPQGTNVNFASFKEGVLKIRTYERGVESETLACGTGAVASALLSSINYNIQSPVTVITASGEKLKVYFEKEGQKFKNVYLEGITTWVYDGELKSEIFKQRD